MPIRNTSFFFFWLKKAKSVKSVPKCTCLKSHTHPFFLLQNVKSVKSVPKTRIHISSGKALYIAYWNQTPFDFFLYFTQSPWSQCRYGTHPSSFFASKRKVREVRAKNAHTNFKWKDLIHCLLKSNTLWFFWGFYSKSVKSMPKVAYPRFFCGIFKEFWWQLLLYVKSMDLNLIDNTHYRFFSISKAQSSKSMWFLCISSPERHTW